MLKYKLFIGIDVSKDKIDVAYYKGKGESIYIGEFLNNINGFDELLKKLKGLKKGVKSTWYVCFENTGTYSKDLLAYLAKQKIACREEDPQIMGYYLDQYRGKTDKDDSINIAGYAYKNWEGLELSKPLDEHFGRLQAWLTRRDLLVRQKTEASNSFHATKRAFEGQALKDFSTEHEELMAILRAKIKETEQQIKQIIKEDEALKGNDKLLQSIKGIGPMISAYMILTSRNFQRFDLNARKYSSYSGTAPFPNSSGKYKGRNRVSKRKNKKVKAILSNGANAAINHDKQIRAYYNRKVKEGKEYKVILNAVKNKLIARAFAVIKRQTPFVDLESYRS